MTASVVPRGLSRPNRPSARALSTPTSPPRAVPATSSAGQQPERGLQRAGHLGLHRRRCVGLGVLGAWVSVPWLWPPAESSRAMAARPTVRRPRRRRRRRRRRRSGPASRPRIRKSRALIGPRSVAREAEQVPAVVHPLVHGVAGDQRGGALFGGDEVERRRARAARRTAATAGSAGRRAGGRRRRRGRDGDRVGAWDSVMCPPGLRRPVVVEPEREVGLTRARRCAARAHTVARPCRILTDFRSSRVLTVSLAARRHQ